MAVPSFPVLSKKPDKQGYRKRRLYDPTIRSETENGVVLARSRHTRVPWQWWVTYRGLPQSDVDLLEAFEGTTVLVGATVFTWTDPVTNVVHYCRLAEEIDIQLEPEGANAYQVTIHLAEATGTFA